MPDTDLQDLGRSIAQSLTNPAATQTNAFNLPDQDSIDVGKEISRRLFVQEEAPQQKPKEKAKPRGMIAEIGSAVGSGLDKVGEALAGTAEMAGIPGAGKVREYYKERAEMPERARPDYLQEGTVWEHPERLSDWRWWVRSLGENLPNMAVSYAPQALAIKGAMALNWGKKAIAASAAAAGWSSSFTMEAGSAYSQAKDEMTKAGTFDPETIERVATGEGLAVGTVNAILDAFAVDRALLHQVGADRLVKRIVRQFMVEGGTETAQEAVNVLAEKVGHKPDQTFSDNIGRLLEAGIIGGAMGGMAGGAIGTHQHTRNVKIYNQLADELQVKVDMTGWKEEGLSDKEIADRVEERIQEARSQAAEANKDLPAEEQKQILPEIDAGEMTSYVLYGNAGKIKAPFSPEPGPIEKKAESAKAKVYRALGLKEKTTASATPPADATPMSTGAVEQKTQVMEPQRQAILDDEQKEKNRTAGLGLFDAVLNEDLAEQQQLEAARQEEIARQEEETSRIAAEEEAATNAAVADAQNQQAALKANLAGDDLRKQAMVDEVLGLSERQILTAVRKELGLTINPAGPDSYALDTPNGPQPVNLSQIREQLAGKRIEQFDAAEQKREADAAAVQARQQEAQIKKEEKAAAWALKTARETLSMNRTLTDAQRELLNASRDALTPEEIAKLDKPKSAPPPSVQILTGKKTPKTPSLPLSPPETEAAKPETNPVLSETDNPDYKPEPRDKEAQRRILISEMIGQLDNAGDAGVKYDNQNDSYSRLPSGVSWLTDVNKSGLSVSKADARTVLVKTRENNPLTERQQEIRDAILAAAEERGVASAISEAAHWTEKGFEPVPDKSVNVNDLVEGDRFVIDGEEFAVTDIDDKGNLTLKDGKIRKVREGAVLQGVDFIKQAEDADDFNAEEFVSSNEVEKPEAKTTEEKPDEESQKAETLLEAPAKEPWQMTREEIARREKDAGQIDSYTSTGITVDGATIPYERTNFGKEHKKAVEKALADGKSVPEEVLKDYPDLVTKQTSLPETSLSDESIEFTEKTTPQEINAIWSDLFAEHEAIVDRNQPLINALKEELQVLKGDRSKEANIRKKAVQEEIDKLASESQFQLEYAEMAFIEAHESLAAKIHSQLKKEGITDVDEDEVHDLITELADGRINEYGWNKPLMKQVIDDVKEQKRQEEEAKKEEAALKDNIFTRMPNDVLKQQADYGVQGAKDELARRQAEKTPPRSVLVLTGKKTPAAKATTPAGNSPLASFYSAEGPEKDTHKEGWMITSERAFKKELKRFAKELNAILGWEVDRDKKGKDISVSTNVPPAGGDGHIILWKPGSEYGIYIDVKVERNRENDGLDLSGLFGKNPQLMYRVNTKQSKYSGGVNRWAPAQITPRKLAAQILNEVEFYEQVQANKIIKEAQNAGHTDQEIADAFREGEKAGEIKGTVKSTEEIREEIASIAEELNIEVKENASAGLETKAPENKIPQSVQTLTGKKPKPETKPDPAPDLTTKSTHELVQDIFAIINDHIGQRGSVSLKAKSLDESLYTKIKPYIAVIADRAKAKALDIKAYLFGAVDSMPEGDAKEIYETAAERYIEDEKALNNQPPKTNNDSKELSQESTSNIIEEKEDKESTISSQIKKEPGPPSREVNTEDSGVELAYNRRGRIRTGIKWEDIADKNETLKARETNKPNVYPRPDYEGMIAGGMKPLITHIVKQVYDSLSTSPMVKNTTTDPDLKLYIDAINRVMNGVISWASDNDAIVAWGLKNARYASMAAGKTTNISDLTKKNGKELLEFVYPEGYKNYLPELRIVGGNKVLRSLQPGYDEIRRAMKDIDKGWPAKQEAWQRQGWQVVETAKAATVEELRTKEPSFSVRINGWATHGGIHKTREEATSAKKDLKPFLLLNKHTRIEGQFDTREEALKAAKEKVKREGVSIKEQGIEVSQAERLGPDRRLEGEDITSDRLKDAFGFKGVNFGNWMKGETNKLERQLHLNHAYDAFMDLADVLGVPPKAMSLNGLLGVAFGAQGNGKAAAHFVPGVNEINLTRVNGAGALAHEYGHSLDHYFANQAGLAGAQKPYLTHNLNRASGDIRPEIVEHFKAIVEAMNKRPITPEEHAKQKEQAQARAHSWTEGWLKSIGKDFEKAEGKEEFDKLADRVMRLDLGEGSVNIGGRSYLSPVVVEIRDLYKKLTGRVYSLDSLKSLQANVNALKYSKSEKSSEKNHIPQMVKSNYFKDSLAVGKGKADSYWTRPTEMFSRAFDAYVTDTLADQAAKNTYLSGLEIVPPKGEERKAINTAFEALINEIKTRETEQGVEMYSVEAWHGSPHTFDIFDLSKIGTGEGAQVYGYGLYFAGAKEIAEWYKENLSANAEKVTSSYRAEYSTDPYEPDRTGWKVWGFGPKGEPQGSVHLSDTETDAESKAKLTRFFGNEVAADFFNKLDTTEDFTIQGEGFNKGRLYKVALAPEEDEYLLWDKPLSEQSEKVRNALKPVDSMLKALGYERGINDPRMTGDKVYNRIAIEQAKTNGKNDKAASEYLYSLGIPGIKYLDGTSRGKGSGNYNYVIFSDDDIAIKERYSKIAEQTSQDLSKPYRLGEVPLRTMVDHLAGIIKGISVEDRNGELWLKTKSGKEVLIVSADFIDSNRVALTLGYHYGSASAKSGTIAGMYTPGKKGALSKKTITLVRNVAGVWTLSHEFYHFLEDIGAISNADKAVLNRKIEALIKKDPDTFGFLKGRSLTERRAEWVGRTLVGIYDPTTTTGKILRKIQDILDAIVNAFGIRTARGVLRDIETGKIYEKEPGNMPGTMPASSQESPQYSLAEDLTADVVEKASRKIDNAVATLIGRGNAQRVADYATFKEHFKEFWQPFSTVKDGDKALAKRYQSMGNVAKAVRFIQGIQEQLDTYPPEVKKALFWHLNGEIPVEALPEEARPVAQALHRRTEIIGEMLVDRGIISEATFKKHQGKYIHYMYAKHIVGDDSPVGITSSGKLDLSYTKRRNPNLTMQQRKELGLIEDASVAVPVGMGKALTDIAKFDYLNTIAANVDWVWQPSLVRLPIGKPLAKPIRGRTRRYVTMGVGKLVEMVKTYDEMVRVQPTAEVKDIHRILVDALEKAKAISGNAPSDFVQLPNTKGYGPLAGAYVRKPIADDIRPVMDVNTDRGKLLNTIVSIERQGMAAFKMGKVALNFPTAVRNVVSNIIQNNMRGRPLAKIPGDMIAACESLKAKDSYYEEAFGMGLFNTNWFATEINDVLQEFRKAETGRFDQIFTALKNLAKYYGKIDDLNKHAIFLQLRKEGKPVDEAALEALKWGMDYSLTSRSIKGLRQTIMPFATYSYKIAPLIAECLKKRPWVLAKFALIYPAAKMLAMGLHDLDDDDWDDLVKQLPAYIKKSGSMMVLPWKTDKGQWQWVNLEYFFPWGNYLAMFRDLKAADSGEFLRDMGIGNPFLSMFFTGISAREDQAPIHAYFGTAIYNELDPAPIKAAKYLEYMLNTWMPSMLTRQGAAGYTGKMLTGSEDRWGREVSFGQALGRWFGFNIVSVSPEQSRAQASVRIQELKKEMARVEADPSRSEEEKTAYRARLNRRLGEIATEAPAAILPITKAKGNDPAYEALKDMAEKGILHTAPPSRSMELHGVPMKMTMDQYSDYLDRSSEIARRKLTALVESPTWEQMTDKRKGDVVDAIVANARKAVRQKIKAEMLRDNREKVMQELERQRTQRS